MDKMRWSLVMKNYKDEDSEAKVIHYFKNYKIAKANFEVICEKYKDYDGFKEGKTFCMWWDHYNTYPTYVFLEERYLPKIYDTVIFDPYHNN